MARAAKRALLRREKAASLELLSAPRLPEEASSMQKSALKGLPAARKEASEPASSASAILNEEAAPPPLQVPNAETERQEG